MEISIEWNCQNKYSGIRVYREEFFYKKEIVIATDKMNKLFATIVLLLSFCFYTKAEVCTVGSVIAAGTPCVTSVVLGLTKQIAGELSKMGIAFASIDGNPGISCVDGCSGLIQKGALDSLISITSSLNKTIEMDSAWRSTAQQYLLFQWKAQKKCDQTNPVFTPGTSNHEGGIAIDVPDYSKWITPLTTNGWNYPMPQDDPVHFEHGQGSAYYAKQNLVAFQRLWNRNNPGEEIAEDGIYGDETARALEKSPCNGWGSGDALN